MSTLRWLGLGLVLLTLGSLTGAGNAAGPARPGPLTEQEKAALEKEIKRWSAEGAQLWNAGRAREAVQAAEKALLACERRYPAWEYPDGDPNVAICLSNLGFVLGKLGESRQAQPYHERALEMQQRLHGDKDHPDVARSLSDVGFVLLTLGESRQAQPYLKRALEMQQRLHGDKDHPDVARSLSNLGSVLHSLGEAKEALPYFEKALAMQLRLHGNRDHPDVALSLNNMAGAHGALGEAKEALPYYKRALEMRLRLHGDKDHPDVAVGLNNLAGALKDMGELKEALPYFEKALAMNQRLHGDRDHPDVARSLSNVAHTLVDLGDARKAQPYHERALEMRLRLYGDRGHPDVARSLNSLGSVLLALGESKKALPYFEKALAIEQRLRGDRDHPNVAMYLHNLGTVQESLGESKKALPYFEKALAIEQRLRGDRDHPNVAMCLSGLGILLENLGESRQAQPYHERALEMRLRLHGDKDHPDVARSLSNLGLLLVDLAEPRKAQPYLKRALEMRLRLHGDKDHPDVARSLNNLGFVLGKLGESEKAQPYHERALEMRLRLHGNRDHPDVAICLSNLGATLQELGEARKALPLHEKALAMQRRLVHDNAGTAAESEALAYAARFPLSAHALLSCSDLLRDPADDAAAYGHAFASKATLTRALQTRHLATRSSADPKVKAAWEELRDARRRLALALNDPAGDPKTREGMLRDLTRAKEAAERTLAELLPELKAQRGLDAGKPDDLAKLLPADAAFVDLVRYCHFEKDTKEWRYVAFVVRNGQPIQRVNLGAAGDVDAAVAAWLEDINAWKPDLPRKDQDALLTQAEKKGDKVRELVWAPLARHLPRGLKTLYLSPDGDLARVPWAALPVGEGEVLLERCVVCTVPHGLHLVERLGQDRPAPEGSGRVLAVGGVAYGTPPGKPAGPVYPPLKATAAEAEAVLARAGDRRKTSLQGKDATTVAVLAELQKASYAHLATHGQFKADLLAEEWKRREAQMKGWEYSPLRQTERVGLGLRSPLAYVGVALAGANDPAKAGPDGGVLSAEALAEADLSRLRLAVLSACETGLGQYTQGEGTQGLVRAFHVGGCPDVVASLWKVDDAATAALMTKFYDALWAQGRTSPEALREAQLLVYRRPDLLPDLLGERGAPRLEEAVKVSGARAEPPKEWKGLTRTPPKLWAAFVHSGAGR